MSKHRHSRNTYQILKGVTADLLDRMQRRGWWFGWGENSKLVHDRPLPWDINNGHCEEWAEKAVEVLGKGEVVWLEDIDSSIDRAHCVVALDGRFYDAQALKGVDSIQQLPLVRRVPRSK